VAPSQAEIAGPVEPEPVDVEQRQGASGWRRRAAAIPGRVLHYAEPPQFGEPTGLGYVSNDSIVPDALRQAEIRSPRLPMRVYF
jgi:hypothetical protein